METKVVFQISLSYQNALRLLIKVLKVLSSSQTFTKVIFQIFYPLHCSQPCLLYFTSSSLPLLAQCYISLYVTVSNCSSVEKHKTSSIACIMSLQGSAHENNSSTSCQKLGTSKISNITQGLVMSGPLSSSSGHLQSAFLCVSMNQ